MNQIDKQYSYIWLILAAALLLSGLAAIAFSRMPLAELQAWLSSWTVDGKADFLTPYRHQRLVMGSRAMGAACILLSALAWLFRRRFALWVQELNSGLAEMFDELVRAMKGMRGCGETGHFLLLALIMGLALALRLLYINLPIRYDEATTFVEYASKPFPVLISYYSAPNNHIFHSALVSLSTWIFSDGLWAIRLPALLAGWLMVPAAYLAFRLLYNKQVGLTAAALVAVCPVLVEFSVNARGYSLVALFFLLLLSLAAYLRTKPILAGWLLFVLISALGMWTVPTMALPLSVVVIWWLLSPATGRARIFGKHNRLMFAAVVSAALLTALLYTPVVLGTGFQSLWKASGAGFREPSSLLLTNTILGPWSLTVRHWPVLFALALLALVMLGFLAHWLIDRQGAWIGFAGLIGPALVLLALGSNPFTRVWLFLSPVILGIAAVGLNWIAGLFVSAGQPKIVHGVAVIALAAGLGLYTAWSNGICVSEEGAPFRDAAAITQRIAKQWRPDDALLTACPADEPLAYQFKLNGFPVAPVFALLTGGLERAGRIWVVTKPPPGPSLKGLMGSAGSQVKGFNPPELIEKYPQSTLYLMKRKSSSLATEQ